MKTTLVRWHLATCFLLFIPTNTSPAQAVPASPSTAAGRGAQLAAIEEKLLGSWRGAACAGDYTFNADGTFRCCNFTPGQNTITGTWSIRWDALPPTLVLTCLTSDFTQKDPTRPEYKQLGKALELKLVELNDQSFAYQLPRAEGDNREPFVWSNSRGTDDGEGLCQQYLRPALRRAVDRASVRVQEAVSPTGG